MTHRLFTFLPDDKTNDAYHAALKFVSGKADHHFLTLVGEPGRGKTHIAFGIGWHWLEHNMDSRGLVKYYQVETLMDELIATFLARYRL